MSANYKEYLAATLLNDDVVVSYRLLSRELKVSCNEAKRMLYDFHRTQSARNPSSIHATYLIAGTRKLVTPQTKVNGRTNSQPNGSLDGESDIRMQDSFPFSSAPESSPFEALESSEDIITESTMLLVGQETLENAKVDFESIKTIHIYSLEPGPVSDLAVLSDCNRKVAREYTSEDPLETWKTYGTIHNPRAKRRAMQQPLQPASTQAIPSTAGMRATQAKNAHNAVTSDTTNSKSSVQRGTGVAATDKAAVTASQPTRNRSKGNSIMSSFSKTPAPKKSLNEDAPMKDVADDEGEELALDTETSEEARLKAETSRKARKDREDQLRKMMEDEDGEEGAGEDEADDHEMANDSDTAADATGDSQARSEEASQDPTEIQQSAPPGRRRGRRKVIKKKTMKDAEGYLVTQEEEAWESFSEDDASQPSKANTLSSKPSSASSKPATGPRSSSAKKGQGNIMNFFGKG